MTAFDRQQIIEDAARAMYNKVGQWPWERLSTEEPLWAEGWRDNAKAALPVIVAAALKPIRELHAPINAADYSGGPFGGIIRVCTACKHRRRQLVAAPGHTYGTPGRGARAVTVIERSRSWGYWCINHPHEPASVGHPASQVIDGEALVTRRLAELETEIDPRRDVDRRQGMGGYVYMCRECSTSFGERLRAARREAVATPIPEPEEDQ